MISFIKSSRFIWTLLGKAKGPGTTYQSPFMFLNMFKNIIYLEMYHLANFNVLI